MEAQEPYHLISKGDNNTKFFHKFVSQRSRDNIIWNLEDGVGRHIYKLKDIHNEVVRYFGNLYKDREGLDIHEYLWVIKKSPTDVL